jgi:Galactosyltransferase
MTTTQKRNYSMSTTQGKSLLPTNKRVTTSSGNSLGVSSTTTTKCVVSGTCLNMIFICTLTVALAFQIYGTSVTFRDHVFSENNNSLGISSAEQQRTLLNTENPCPLVTSATTDVKNMSRQQNVATKYRVGKPPHSGRLRVLIGILSADFFNDQVYRKRHRNLFQLWNDPRVCSLPDFKSMPLSERYVCELIYTFVLGANPDASPELVDHSRPFEVDRPISGTSRDLNEPDMTLLNIRENMNEGKSQTWMYYGSKIAEEYDLDYVGKVDADSMLHLHEFFHFAYKNMPPSPYNSMMYIGALRDKAYWPKHTTDAERVKFESYFGTVYDGVHLYVAGQLYIMATDLAKFVGKEALSGKCSYCEGHEDHDISAIAFHSPEPIKLVVIGRTHRFWEHPVKGEPRWKRIWAREQARMSKQPFEGRYFTTNSTLVDVLGVDHVDIDLL